MNRKAFGASFLYWVYFNEIFFVNHSLTKCLFTKFNNFLLSCSWPKKNNSFKCGSVNGWNAFFVDIWTQWICAIAFVGHVHIERNLFMSLDRTSASCDLCALEPIQDLNLKFRQSSIQGVPHLRGFSLPMYVQVGEFRVSWVFRAVPLTRILRNPFF